MEVVKQPAPPADGGIAERLERGGVVYFPTSPFPLPEGDDLRLLLAQRLAGRHHKNIGYDPATGKVSGYAAQASADLADRLRAVLGAFARSATGWLASTLPNYARHWRRDRVSFRPEEEATRKLRLTARNDLLHVDAFPSRPTGGDRILRVFANVNPTEPRVWVTADPFAALLKRYGQAVGLPAGEADGLARRLRDGVLALFRPGRKRRTPYDAFMLRFHNFLKAYRDFQEGPKRRWVFPPGSAWLAMTDTCSHAVLSGRFALEHSYFIPAEALALPEESPAALVARACGRDVLGRAA
jgi:hypothetical protein